MMVEQKARLVVVYVNSSDQWQGRPLYSSIVHLCETKGIAGASVIRVAEGYGGSHHLHTIRLLALSENMPVRIEILDVPEKIDPLLADLEAMISGGLVIISDVIARHYSPGKEK